MDYGDVKIIGCNWNEGKDDPSFATGSKQLTWLDEQLTNADSKWIFIFAHVNVYSTSYWAVVGQPKGIYSAVVGETRIGG